MNDTTPRDLTRSPLVRVNMAARNIWGQTGIEPTGILCQQPDALEIDGGTPTTRGSSSL